MGSPGELQMLESDRRGRGTERGREMVLVGRLSIWTESAFSVRLRVEVILWGVGWGAVV